MNMSARDVRASYPLPWFSVVCWNSCGLLTRSADIILYLHQQQPSIFIIIEPLVTHISQQGFPKHHSYNTVSIKHPHDHRNGGFIIYMHKSITYNQHNAQVPHFTSTTATTTALFHIASPSLPRPFILIPVYMSCNASQRDWDSFTSFLRLAPTTFTHELPVLVMGDMNAHDSLWDLSIRVSDSDIGGRHLSSFLSHPDDWHLLNSNIQSSVSIPTHYPNRPGARPSVLDLAICNDYNLVESFQVLQQDMLSSDHQPIMCTLHSSGLNASSDTYQRYIWRTSRDDIPWDIFRSMLSLLLTSWHNTWSP